MSDDRLPVDGLITHTTNIVASYLTRNSLDPDQVSSLIRKVYEALSGFGQQEVVEEPLHPAVPIRSSVKHDHIVCLEDGRKMKTLRRHLMVEHGLTPDAYRARWGLSSNYPMIALDYAEERRAIAKKIGLGRMPDQRRGRQKVSRG